MSKRARQQYRQAWLRQHARLEAGFSRALTRAYKRLSAELGKSLDETRDLSQAFDLEAWQAAILGVAETWQKRAALAGAGLERSLAKSLTKQTVTIAGARIEIPADVMAAIDSGLESQIAQPFWQNIALRDRQRIADVLSNRIESGDSWKEILRSIGKVVRDPSRTQRIARTEVTGALNSGHAAARDDLIRAGLVTGSEWLDSGDGEVRESHVEASGQVIGAGELFKVGEASAPYPGHWSLPASERTNCRCLTIASGVFA